ncbi:MAG: hypothetical protein R2757_02460 [Draconibacterium sp.]|jgi:hypothetical protein
MKNKLLKLFGASTKKIPDSVKKELMEQFPEAINIEWDVKDDFYEAIFYVNEVEYIAKVSDEEGLTGYKKNLKLDELPEIIKVECEQTGEIMNAIAIHTKSSVLYEVIIRDKEFNRTLLLLSKNGELLESSSI